MSINKAGIGSDRGSEDLRPESMSIRIAKYKKLVDLNWQKAMDSLGKDTDGDADPTSIAANAYLPGGD